MAQTMQRRRSRGDGGVYQRSSDGLWVGALDLGYGPDPRTGEVKRRRKVIYAKTKTEALRKLRKLKAEQEVMGDLPTSSMTLAKWLDKWLIDAQYKLKPKTWRTYKTYCAEYLVPFLGRKRLDKLTPDDVHTLHRYVLGKGLSSTTARNAHRVLSSALKAAVRHGHLNRNVASADYVDVPRKAESDRQGLTAEQAIAVLKAAQDDRLASRWMFGFLTGARQGEILGLRWSHLDLEEGIADLAWSLTQVPWAHGCQDDEPAHTADFCPKRQLVLPPGIPNVPLYGNFVLLPPKTKGSTRVVPLAEPLRLALVARRQEHLKERDSYQADYDLVWCRPTGLPIDARRDWAAWKRLLRKAGVPDATLHESRHTAASLLAKLDVPDDVIMQILGHSDVVTTNGYKRVDIERARKAVAKLGSALALN